jgi:hypothetical protein
MLFESRELNSYAEPVLAADLRVGEVYFIVQYVDDKLCVPIISPLIFLGNNLTAGDIDLLYFQDYESHAAGIRHESAREEEAVAFHVYSSNELNHIFEYERALDQLMKCSLRRRALRKSP